FTRLKENEKGSALIIALLVTLVLSLLALSLSFQADTEKTISINERDSFEALHVAEIGVQWAKRAVYREAHENDKFTNFTDLLEGVDRTKDTDDDHLLGLGDMTLNSITAFNSGNENTDPPTSAKVCLNFDTNTVTDFVSGTGCTSPAESYEALRVKFDDPAE